MKRKKGKKNRKNYSRSPGTPASIPWSQQTSRNLVDVKEVFLKNSKNLGKSNNAKRGKNKDDLMERKMKRQKKSLFKTCYLKNDGE